ncbi:MAG: hypothetical protein U0K71_12130 [Paludibacteraceae bacterium]|nr:hypothetical protein [Paludibacteraceae bacterium]MDD5997028.1 hypothetical protein [Bacteroidales bacterium]MEE1177744.1 hypothetical protein [Paludibacteraceae bacterium]
MKTKLRLQYKIYLVLSYVMAVLYIARYYDKPVYLLMIIALLGFVVWNLPIYEATEDAIVEWRLGIPGLLKGKVLKYSEITRYMPDNKNARLSNYGIYTEKESIFLSERRFSNIEEFVEYCKAKSNV